jgi:membrane protease YdiL (CAAX protease family)
VPFWDGILSALGAVGASVFTLFAGAVLLVFVAVLVTGHMPSTNPGHPLAEAAGIASYAAAGYIAWWRLRVIGFAPFRTLRGSDVRAILIGVAVLILVRIGTAVQLIATHQTNHVQSGFEHFSVVSKIPNVTLISVTLAVVSAVILAPIVEEIIFRALLFGALASRIGVLAAALVSGAIFGAVHGDLVLFPSLAALGFVAAIAYAATGNLWVSITLHAVNNAVGAAFLVATSLQA